MSDPDLERAPQDAATTRAGTTPRHRSLRPGARAAFLALGVGGLALAAASCGSGAQTTAETDASATRSATPTDPVPWETASSGSSDGSGTSTPSSSGSKGASSTSRTFPSPSDTGAPFDREDFVEGMRRAVAEAPTAEIDVDVVIDGEIGASATGSQDVDADALDMEVDIGGQTLAYRYVDGRYYLAQPPKWVEVDEDSADPTVQTTLEQIEVLSMKRQLTAFAAGVTSVGDKGTEDVNGTQTTHYVAQVDTSKALGAIDMTPAPGTPESVLYDVWLDEDDLIRKMSFTQGDVEATMLADRWGEPVDIQAPDDSEIAQQ